MPAELRSLLILLAVAVLLVGGHVIIGALVRDLRWSAETATWAFEVGGVVVCMLWGWIASRYAVA